MGSKIGMTAVLVLAGLLLVNNRGLSQEVKAAKSQSMALSGRVQMQHLYNTDIESDASRTNNGFRMRRMRVQMDYTLSNFVDGKVQFEIRDNNPNLKDAYGRIKLFEQAFLRFGQFKVPVWREELRSSSKLLLVERSAAAEFLADNLLSARHVGLEFGGDLNEQFSFVVNYSNGAGEGIREDAGRSKSDAVNNGKMFSARVNAALSKMVQVGVSAVANSLGNEVGTADNSGTVSAIAPDFGLYLPSGLDIEGGVALGNISKDLLQASDDQSFTVIDITGRWKTAFATPNASLGGIDAFEFAAGYSYVEPNGDVSDDEATFLRFGPAVYFGKNARLQINGEFEMPAAAEADDVFLIRSQITVNL